MNKRPTPESDKAKIAFTSLFANDDAYWIPYVVGIKLENERDRLAELHNKNAIHFNELLELCGALRKERDRLAEALRSVIDEDGTPMSINLANEVLQSLTTNEPISQ